MKTGNQQGFTLMELLVVVIIIGILATIALPQFAKTVDKAREAEASSVVGSLLTGEYAYFQETATVGGGTPTFTTDPVKVMVAIPTMKYWTAVTPFTDGDTSKATITFNSNHGHSAAGNHTVVGSITSLGLKTITSSGAGSP